MKMASGELMHAKLKGMKAKKKKMIPKGTNKFSEMLKKSYGK